MNFHYLIRTSFILLFIGTSLPAAGHDFGIRHVEPMHWWTGMKNNKLQILVHGKNISGCTASLRKGETGLRFLAPEKTSNPNYLFINVQIEASAKPGTYHIRLAEGKKVQEIPYVLKSRLAMPAGAAGYGPEDVLYLLMPDRFANGNPANDDVEGCLERANRSEPSGRHGGDLAGIENHLPYFQQLGVTTLWLNPVLENNEPHYSYHGYAFTDLYKIDPRFGTLDDYKRLIGKCHGMGLKMVQDMVANHIGDKHWWMDDLPAKDWVFPPGDPFNRSNFRIETVPDPYRTKYDKDKMVEGWFDVHMPDLNQGNPLLARYLIQNSIWWIAETGIDGIRMDTYPYNKKEYMTDWCNAILAEFPKFSLVGEVWVDQPSLESYFVKGAKNHDGYVAGLPTVTDFPLYFSINKGLNEKGTWETGMQRVYTSLAQDFLYKDPSRHLIFLENHDLTRFLTYHKGDVAKSFQAMAMLLTLRGVPQLYYGFELAMEGDGASHPNVRQDFPGGWPGDPLNAFEPSGRKGRADSTFNYLQHLLQWRKKSAAVTKGSFHHYLPEKNIYPYYRQHGTETVVVLVNGNAEPTRIATPRLDVFRKKPGAFRDVIANRPVEIPSDSLLVPGQGILILEQK